MSFRTTFNKIIEPFGYTIQEKSRKIYDQDGLRSIHNHDFMTDPSFVKSYQRGVVAAGNDYLWHWRVHIGLWAAYSASKLAGDFVECGVNRGFLSSAIMEYLDWDSQGKTFYLLDTFCGIDNRYLSENEIKKGALEKNKTVLESGFYADQSESVRVNFSQWNHIKIIQGSIPETLTSVETNKISYLHLDMNCSLPEVAALNFFWEKLSPGAFILFDDYAYAGHESQKKALDSVAKTQKSHIVSLPSGQGLLIKPA
ncbi:MAG: TylF/MycF family methyltransferase [Desulfobacteraceae bacterium]|nr:TylF/MycF family methyltransferase [Desulfobacteraceae bacterium]